MGILKLGLLLSKNFGRSYISQIKSVLRVWRQYLIALENIFPIVYSTFIPNLTPMFSFDHNSCKSSPNDQCKGTLSIYAWSYFQWYHGGPIWCLFSFSTKALNIHNSHINVIPKMGMHLGVIALHPWHSPPFVRVCFTRKHAFDLMGLALHTFS
jgi:hypothetical protein